MIMIMITIFININYHRKKSNNIIFFLLSVMFIFYILFSLLFFVFQNGNTPLGHAAEYKLLDVCRMLIEKGASTNVADNVRSII